MSLADRAQAKIAAEREQKEMQMAAYKTSVAEAEHRVRQVLTEFIEVIRSRGIVPTTLYRAKFAQRKKIFTGVENEITFESVAKIWRLHEKAESGMAPGANKALRSGVGVTEDFRLFPFVTLMPEPGRVLYALDNPCSRNFHYLESALLREGVEALTAGNDAPLAKFEMPGYEMPYHAKLPTTVGIERWAEKAAVRILKGEYDDFRPGKL